jgi:hypothetical protein
LGLNNFEEKGKSKKGRSRKEDKNDVKKNTNSLTVKKKQKQSDT